MFSLEIWADLNKGYPDTAVDFNIVPAGSEGRRDWIAKFDARAKYTFSQGNDGGYIHNQRLADILRRISGEKLQGYHKGGHKKRPPVVLNNILATASE